MFGGWCKHLNPATLDKNEVHMGDAGGKPASIGSLAGRILGHSVASLGRDGNHAVIVVPSTAGSDLIV